MTQKTYTKQQIDIVSDLCQTHNLQPDQIGFEGDDINPIFDYEANSLLSLRLTDIAMLDCSAIERDGNGVSVCICNVILPDGRSRAVSDSAAIGDEMFDGTKIGTARQADALARARASRLGIRSVGVNLFNAHKHFKQTGQIARSHTDQDPRKTAYAEIHVLATELDLIVDGDRKEYERFIAASFDGKTSSKQLNDIEFRHFINQLRAMAKHSRTRSKVPA